MLIGIRSGFGFSLQNLYIQTMKHELTFAAGNLTITESFQNCQFLGGTISLENGVRKILVDVASGFVIRILW